MKYEMYELYRRTEEKGEEILFAFSNEEEFLLLGVDETNGGLGGYFNFLSDLDMWEYGYSMDIPNRDKLFAAVCDDPTDMDKVIDGLKKQFAQPVAADAISDYLKEHEIEHGYLCCD